MKKMTLLFISLFTVVCMFSQTYEHPVHRPDCQLSIDTLGKVTICIGDSVNGKVFLQQFKWNKWLNIDSAMINGNVHDTCFTRKILYVYSPSQFRLRDGNGYYSQTLKVDFRDSSKICGLESYRCHMNGTIHFGCIQHWQIYDQYGNCLKTGTSKDIDLQGLPKGGYFINYGDNTGEFFVD